MANPVVSIEGVLHKKTTHSLLKWQERYYSVKNGRMYWYKNAKSYECINSIPLEEILKVEAAESKKAKFNVVTAKKTYTLVAQSHNEL